MKIHKQRRDSGFTLIEMAISIMIIGVLLSGAFQIYQQYKNSRTQVREQIIRERIISALAAYAENNNRLPCPSNPQLTPFDNSFGEENVSGCPAGAGVVQGMVPVSALNLPFHLAADSFSNKMTYAVSASLTQPNGLRDIAAIQLIDQNGQQRPVPFVLVGHGPDGKGAYGLLSTTIGIPCSGPAPDVENCNGDNRFRDMQYARQPAAPANHFDDFIVYNLYPQETSTWVAAPTDDGLEIGNKNNANVGIGVTTPNERLHVRGEVLVDSATENSGIRASNDMRAQRTAPNSGGEIRSDGRVEAVGEITSDRIRSGLFVYE